MTDTVSRRDLLRATLGVGGAFVLEFVLPACGPRHVPPAVQPGVGPNDFTPSAWIRITPDDRVIFTLDRVEMGQGTMTSHAQLVAEELEIPPSRLVIELAGADRAYDNPDSQLGFQITGGSTSVRASFEPLRRAAATAREMLREVAARRFDAPLASCRADDGAIVHDPSGRRLRYGDLASEAARGTIPEVQLKPRSQFKWIGSSVPRLDARTKVDGTGIYGIDVTVPGMVVAVIIRPPTLDGTLVRFDATKARATPGFVDVVRVPQGVAVVAQRYWQARRAAALVEIEWAPGATAIDSVTLRKSYAARARKPGNVVNSTGNIDKAERAAAHVIEAQFEVPYLAHAPLEPQNATARVTREHCELWAPTQAPGLAREAAHRITGLAYSSITVHQTLVGGGFGRRLPQDYVEEAIHVAMRVPHPVKVIWSREDDMRHSLYRPMVTSLVRGAIDKNGRVLSWSHRIVSQSILAQIVPEFSAGLLPNAMPLGLKHFAGRAAAGIYGGGALEDSTAVEGASSMAYQIPARHFEFAPVVHPVPVGSWRSVGASHNVFVVESFLDELAHAAGKDPVALRRELLPTGSRERRVLDLAVEKAGWTTPPPAGRFRGVAQACSFHTYCAQVAEVSVKGREVRVHRVVAAIDCGLVVNPDIVKSQVESAIVFGLGAALRQEITWKHGAVEQGNFDGFEPLRMHEVPVIEVYIVASDEPPSGVGEPGLPPIAPAVANAIFRATGRPIRTLPISRALAEREPLP